MGKGLCFTGHRPEKLCSKFHENSEDIISIKNQLRTCVEQAIADGFDTFYTGMARGVDIFAGEIVMELRENHPIKLMAVVPYKGQEKFWDEQWQKRYNKLIDNSDGTFVLYDKYYKYSLQERNEFMVENSQRVIAVYNGSLGGTRNTIEFARIMRKEIVIIKTSL